MHQSYARLYQDQVVFLQEQKKYEPQHVKAYKCSCNTCKTEKWVTGVDAAIKVLAPHQGHYTWVTVSKKDRKSAQIPVKEMKGMPKIVTAPDKFFDSQEEMLRFFELPDYKLQKASSQLEVNALIKYYVESIKQNLGRWAVLDNLVLYRCSSLILAIQILDMKDVKDEVIEVMKLEDSSPFTTADQVVRWTAINVLDSSRADFFVARNTREKEVGKELLKQHANLRCKELI